jgi:hypothetical protein
MDRHRDLGRRSFGAADQFQPMIKLVHTTASIALAGLIVLLSGCDGNDEGERRAGPPPPPPEPPRADTLRDCANAGS